MLKIIEPNSKSQYFLNTYINKSFKTTYQGIECVKAMPVFHHGTHSYDGNHSTQQLHSYMCNGSVQFYFILISVQFQKIKLIKLKFSNIVALSFGNVTFRFITEICNLLIVKSRNNDFLFFFFGPTAEKTFFPSILSKCMYLKNTLKVKIRVAQSEKNLLEIQGTQV